MKQVQLETRVYYVGKRYIPMLDNPKYGKFPLKEDKGVKFFDVPTPYAKSLVEGTPAMFCLELKTATQFDGFSDNNLDEYAKSRGLNSPEGLFKKAKEDNPEPKADGLKEVADSSEVDIDKLKAEADAKGITYHPNIGVKKLAEKLAQ